MYSGIVQFAAVVLFLGCVWHARYSENRWFAAQWFIAGYLFGIFRETVMQVAFPTYFYDASILRLGAAPALVSLLWGSIAYLAYVFARRLAPPQEYVPFAALVFVIAASLILPIEATATQLGWWVYEDPVPTVFGRVPVTAPAIWGGAAVLFYIFFQRITATRLPPRGQMYAMITFSPIIAALHVLYTLLLAAILG
jgi:hypothetical protein